MASWYGYDGQERLQDRSSAQTWHPTVNEYVGRDVQIEYSYNGSGTLLSETVMWMHGDPLGTIAVMTDTSGNVQREPLSQPYVKG